MESSFFSAKDGDDLLKAAFLPTVWMIFNPFVQAVIVIALANGHESGLPRFVTGFRGLSGSIVSLAGIGMIFMAMSLLVLLFLTPPFPPLNLAALALSGFVQIFLGVRWIFASSVTVIQREKAYDSLGESWAITRGRFWKIAASGLVVILPVTLVGTIVEHLTRNASGYPALLARIGSSAIEMYFGLACPVLA